MGPHSQDGEWLRSAMSAPDTACEAKTALNPRRICSKVNNGAPSQAAARTHLRLRARLSLISQRCYVIASSRISCQVCRTHSPFHHCTSYGVPNPCPDRRGYKRAPLPTPASGHPTVVVLLLSQVCCLYLTKTLKSTWLDSWLSRVYRIFKIYSIYEPLPIPNPVSSPAQKLPPTYLFFFLLKQEIPFESHHL